jgi:hypothetical protein
MKKKIVFVFVFLCSILSWSQEMTQGPLMQNMAIKPVQFLKTGNTIDSSFIYQLDTISLPVFDDFSSSKFQQYAPDFNAAGISSLLFYHLLDPISNTPLSLTEVFTNQVTFKRVYDAVNSTFIDFPFSATSVKVGDLAHFPVVYQTSNLYPPYYIYDTIGVVDVSDTVWITNPAYTQDSARQFFQPVNDLSKIWADNYAYHNYRYGLNPRSLGVATFDGLNENGYPYQFGTTVTNYGDRLTSKPIDMSMLNASDSVYLSFLYQPEGLGDVPESGDSLLLEFYAPQIDQWFHIWSVNGAAVHPFKAVHVNINDPKFFHKGFKFRIRNYGGLSGALDHFHVDYVHLRSLSYYNDTIFKDFAFSYPLNSLLKTYTAVPWDHYKASSFNKMTDSLEVKVHNGSNTAENYQNGQISVLQNSAPQGMFTLPGFLLAEGQINYNPSSLFTSYHDLSNGFEYDKTLLGIQQDFEVKASASAQFPNFSQNDSTNFTQSFYNFYSYDDGSAEAAFGPTGVQARLAIRYDSYEADSLIGIAMHFVPSVVDVSQKLFLLTVWDNNNGDPGNVLYQDDAFSPRQPLYISGQNNFETYYFTNSEKVAVGTTFFVGWRQLDPDRLNLGLDRNIDHSNTIRYSVDGGNNWFTSAFPGSAMLRPIFSTQIDAVLELPNNQIEETLLIYPNPSHTSITVSVKDKQVNHLSLFNNLGQRIRNVDSNQIDLHELENGVYFVSAPEISSRIYKVIKQ